VIDDPRLREQLELIKAMRLSQFCMSAGDMRLAFWGERIGPIGREILIEHPTVELSRPDQPTSTYERGSDVVAASLLSVLGHAVIGFDITGGRLTIIFDGDLQVAVEPDQRYESWQISSEDGLLIVCTPGGELAVWYPGEHN
jgi:Family of unknown function (DUF6188)